MKNWTFGYSCLFIVYSFFISFLIMTIVNPDLFLWHKIGFLKEHDSELPLQNTVSLISNFFNGGIQLWDPYDQMNYAYTQLSSGIYTLSNILTAFLYIVAYPFLDYPGEVLHSFHSVVWHGINMLIRTIGGFLLLRRFTNQPWIILISIIYLNSLLTSEIYMGLLTNNLYSYLPLLLFFIIRFFDHYSLNDFLAALVVMVIAIAGSPLFALGYFYMVVHFFILCMVVYALFLKSKVSDIEKKSTRRQIVTKLCLVITLCFLILLPTFYWANSLKQDFFIEESGLGNTQGRMGHFFSPSKYFNAAKSHRTEPRQFLERSLDFEKNDAVVNWLFVGGSTLFLSLIAMIYAKNKLKHVFFWTIVLVILSNCPRDAPFYFALAHWINGYTNPFSVLVRGFHMPALLMPLLFLPLIACGLEAIVDLIKNRDEKRALFGSIFFFVAIIYLALTNYPFWVKNYAIAMALLFLIFFYHNHRPKITYYFLAFIIIADLALLSVYLNKDKFWRNIIEPTSYTGLGSETALIVEFQNPRILPLREYFQAFRRNIRPSIFTLQGHYGLFYQFTPMDRFFEKPTIYTPRPKIYQGMDADINLQNYLKKHNHLFSFSENKPIEEFLEYEFNLSTADIRDGSYGREYAFALPKDFPAYLSTTIFTDDINNWNLNINEYALKVAQGKLVTPWTFDVQNVRSGYLVILLPKNIQTNDWKAKLQVKKLEYFTAIWKNEHDSLGWTYIAPSDGQYIIRYPFDPKWNLTIDDKPAEFHKTEGYFIGFPLAAGEHKILLEYWPQTFLRIWILISIIGTLVGFIAVVWYGIFRQTEEYFEKEYFL